MPIYGTDFVTSRMLAPHLRKQQGFEVNTIEDISAGSQLIEIPLAHVATTTDISLSALQTIDGVFTIENVFALVKNQALATDNGIYFPDSSGWRRWEGLRGGMLVTVRNGTTNNDTVWQCANDEITFGTTEIEFIQVGSGGTDELLKVTSSDTTADYLNEKVSVLRGLTKGIGSPSGDESLDIGMPTGTNTQTLVYNGAGDVWAGNSVLRIEAYAVSKDVIIDSTNSSGRLVHVRNSSTGSSARGIDIESRGNGSSAAVCRIFNYNTSGSNNNTLLYLQHNTGTSIGDIIVAYRTALQFRVKADGQILSNYLAGTGNRPVYSDASGNLVNYTNNLVIKQILSISDGAATYRLTDLVFVGDPNRQHVVKYQLEFLTAIEQDVRILLNTADTGLTASGTAKSKSPSEFMRLNDDGTSFFQSLDYTDYIDITLRAGAFPNFVELEFYILPTVATTVTLSFSQTIADAINPITLKAKSRMYMQR